MSSSVSSDGEEMAPTSNHNIHNPYPCALSIDIAAAGTNTTATAVAASSRTLGPVLLKLNLLILHPSRVHQHTHQHHGNNNNWEGPLFCMVPVCVLRDNPSLDTSVSSTCLDLSAKPEEQGNNLLLLTTANSLGISTTPGSMLTTPAPIATGLTTGALCIHPSTTTTSSTSTAQHGDLQ